MAKTKRKAAPKKAAPKKAVPKKAGAAAKSYRINVGDAAPAFRVASTAGDGCDLKSLAGKITVLYFYPKDNTPGCTLEGQDFRKLHAQFGRLGAEIYGVSGDSLKSHENFRKKCGFPFELLSDETGAMGRAYDVIQMKSMYGRTFEGIERSTFVIDARGKLAAVWRKVKVDGHAAEVLEFVKGLKA